MFYIWPLACTVRVSYRKDRRINPPGMQRRCSAVETDAASRHDCSRRVAGVARAVRCPRSELLSNRARHAVLSCNASVKAGAPAAPACLRAALVFRMSSFSRRLTHSRRHQQRLARTQDRRPETVKNSAGHETGWSLISQPRAGACSDRGARPSDAGHGGRWLPLPHHPPS